MQTKNIQEIKFWGGYYIYVPHKISNTAKNHYQNLDPQFLAYCISKYHYSRRS